YGRNLLAMGCFTPLADDRARYRGNRVLRSGSGRFSQDERKVAMERAVCAGALFARSIFLAALLPQPVSTLGCGRAANLDRRQTEVWFREQSFVFRGGLCARFKR